MEVAPDRVTLSCPVCSTPISAEVWRVVDVGQQPDLKSRLLRGQLNVFTCPSCSRLTAVATPLVYHDPQKELFLMLMPSQLGLSGEEQEKTIGQLTNLVMNSLEAEQRKGYLFQPRTFFSMESLRSEILRAEGITDEMVEDQMQKGQLIRDLLEQLEDETSLKKLVEDNREHLDYEFFLFLSASLDQAREDGEQQVAEQLTTLRNRLQQLVAPSQAPPPEGLADTITREQLIQTLFSHKDDEGFRTLVAAARPVLDYQFYQTLTGQIEAAESQGDGEKAKQLTDLRTRLLDLADQLDQEAREALERAAALLRQIVESEDMEVAAEENVEQIDAAFLTTLEANIIAAEQSGQEEIQEKLKKLKEHVVSLLEARLPPEMRLLNQLLSMPDLDSRRELLQEQAELITDDFPKLLELIVEDLRTQGQEEAAEHLAEMVPEVQALLQTKAQDSTTGQGS
jgi:hypothetical protein